jgi:hypothetical protein
MFPLSHEGHLTWGGGDRDTAARLMRDVAIGLADSGATVYHDSTRITFLGTLRSWILPSVTGESTGGCVQVDASAQIVTWRVTFDHFVLIATVLLLIAAPEVADAVKDEPGWFQLALVFLLWLWIVGANYLYSIWRFSSFMRKALREAREPRGEVEHAPISR